MTNLDEVTHLQKSYPRDADAAHLVSSDGLGIVDIILAYEIVVNCDAGF
jgi:hypothetical protein